MCSSKYMRSFKILILISICLQCISCGGGGGSNSSTSLGPADLKSTSPDIVPIYSISGTVTGANNQQVLMTITGQQSVAISTDVSGNYSATGLDEGYYTITPSLAGYTFKPFSQAIYVSGDTLFISVNFSCTANSNLKYSLSGTITDDDGDALKNVVVTLYGTNFPSVTTDVNGNFSFTGLENGTYSVVPTYENLTFNPASQNVTINGGNVDKIVFAAIGTEPEEYTLFGDAALIQSSTCLPGDINKDSKVDILDLSILASYYVQTVSSGNPVDINADGLVNISDLSIFSANYGKVSTCTSSL